MTSTQETTGSTDKSAKTTKRKLQERADPVESVDNADVASMEVEASTGPSSAKKSKPTEVRKVPVPKHRFTPLKDNWMKIFTPVVEHLKLQIRFNVKDRNVEICTWKETEDIANIQKAADFVKAFVLGFEVDDALALLRLDDLFLDSFEVTDVKSLKGDHLARAIGRLAGKNGRTKYTIENVSKTRIVLADSKIHIMGSFQNIQIAKRAICNLILGSPPSKVYGNLATVASRARESF